MSNLGKKRGTVKNQANAITGFGTAMLTTEGDEVGIIAPSLRGLEKIWNKLSMAQFNKKKVRRVVWFPHEALTTLKPRRRYSASPKLSEPK